MDFVIKHSDKPRDSLANYEYLILSNGEVVAEYWHDYRGDYHGIRFISGFTEECPLGRMTDFIIGGGPQPLSLSENAIAYLNGVQG